MSPDTAGDVASWSIDCPGTARPPELNGETLREPPKGLTGVNCPLFAYASKGGKLSDLMCLIY